MGCCAGDNLEDVVGCTYTYASPQLARVCINQVLKVCKQAWSQACDEDGKCCAKYYSQQTAPAACDMWAAGLTLLELATGEEVFAPPMQPKCLEEAMVLVRQHRRWVSEQQR